MKGKKYHQVKFHYRRVRASKNPEKILGCSKADIAGLFQEPAYKKQFRTEKKPCKWTKEEHIVFLDALKRHKRNWSAIEPMFPGKTKKQL